MLARLAPRAQHQRSLAASNARWLLDGVKDGLVARGTARWGVERHLAGQQDISARQTGQNLRLTGLGDM